MHKINQIHLNINPSKILGGLFLIIHLLAIWAIIISYCSWVTKLFLFAFVALSSYRLCWQKALLHDSCSIVECHFIGENPWVLKSKAGQEYLAQFKRKNIIVWSELIMLNFEIENDLQLLFAATGRDLFQQWCRNPLTFGAFCWNKILGLVKNIFVPSSNISLMLCRDSLDQQSWRRLKVFLLAGGKN